MAESERIEEQEVIEAEPVRPLPVRAQSGTIEIWGREFGPLAVAATGGAAAGVAVVAVARAARAPRRRRRGGGSSAAARRSSPAAASWSTCTSSDARRARAWGARGAGAAPLALPVAARARAGTASLRSRGGVAGTAPSCRHAPRQGALLAAARRLRPRSGGVRRPGLVEHPILRTPRPRERPAQERTSWRSRSSGCASRSRSRTRWGSSTRRSSATHCSAPTIHHKPWVRPRRRPWPWEALCWAITAAADPGLPGRRDPTADRPPLGAALPSAGRSRRRSAAASPWPLRDVPSAAVIAGRAPAELASMDLSQGRSVAMVRCAREVARGRARPRRPGQPTGGCWRSPRSVPGRSSASGCTAGAIPTRCPAGDLAYVKLVGLPQGPRPPGDRRGGRGVLRAVRALPRAGGELRAGRLAQGDGSGPAGASRRLVTPARSRSGRSSRPRRRTSSWSASCRRSSSCS